jgi:hypothetical protein
MYGNDWAALSSGMYASCGELQFSEPMRVWHCAALLCEAMRVCCAQCARGHRGSGYGHNESCEGGCLEMHVRCGEVVCAISVAPQDVAMPVQLEHESGGTREAAQVLHALDCELQHDAAPKLVALVLRLDPDLDFGLDWLPARLTGEADALLGSQRHADSSQDHGGVAGQ